MSAKPVFAQPRKAIVLMAEDNPDHVFLARESLREAHLNVDLHVVETGDRCLAFLRQEPPYQDAPRPDLLLLDVNMPRMDGYEVMEEISRDESLRSLTVIVLTTSPSVVDINRMYALGCKSYITKPVDFESFTAAVKKLADYWFDLVILPQP